MLSAKMDRDILKLRLHRMFLLADDPVLNEVASYVRGRISKTPLMRRFIDEHSRYITRKHSHSPALKTSGDFYDLKKIFDSLNAEYFDNSISSSITWGKHRRNSRARTRTLGSYFPKLDLIRINPLLDSRNVPSYFVQYIVYHEMLHAHFGVPDTIKRKTIHSVEFREEEKKFIHYDRAITWERKRW